MNCDRPSLRLAFDKVLVPNKTGQCRRDQRSFICAATWDDKWKVVGWRLLHSQGHQNAEMAVSGACAPKQRADVSPTVLMIYSFFSFPPPHNCRSVTPKITNASWKRAHNLAALQQKADSRLWNTWFAYIDYLAPIMSAQCWEPEERVKLTCLSRDLLNTTDSRQAAKKLTSKVIRYHGFKQCNIPLMCYLSAEELPDAKQTHCKYIH